MGLTPPELRNARKSLGLTQHALAEALRMGKWGWQTISKWENGDTPIPGPAQIAVECLLERKANGKQMGKTALQVTENAKGKV